MNRRDGCEIPSGKANWLDKALLTRMFRAMGQPSIRLVLWDGTVVNGIGEPAGIVHILDRRTLWRLPVNPNLVFGDAYVAGHIDIEGDIISCLRAFYDVMPMQADAGIFSAVMKKLRRSHTNDIAGARANIYRHYDIGNHFYKLWLDDDMVYSGAFYHAPGDDLEAAQQAKMHYICRKLQIRPGDEVVEIGCGWGALARYMAKHYGAKVTAYNISHAQIQYARERTRLEGLEDQITYIEDDYRNISGTYDALVTVGMLEHVGAEHYATFGRIMDACLKKNGRGLIQSVGRNQREAMTGWIEKRIFPGAYVPVLSEILRLVEPQGFSIVNVENLRLHYARTLFDWLERFDAASGQIEQMYDAAFIRTWRLYLAGCCAAFEVGSVELFQLLFARPHNQSLPSRPGGATVLRLD